MQNRYFSTFIGGTYEIIKKALVSYFPDVKIEFHSADLILFTTSHTYLEVGQIPFLNNSFNHIKQFNSSNMASIEAQIDWALNRTTFIVELQKFFGNQKLKFRIVYSKNNQTVKVDSRKAMLLENSIISNTRMKLHRTLPDFEIWFMEKREGYGICGIRVSKHADYQQELERGELRGELSYLMNFLSNPKSYDVYLDPFCGNGSLPINRAKYFPYKKIIAADIDISRIAKKDTSTIKSFEIRQIDHLKTALNLNVNKIVTDPPWGEAEKIEDLGEFYSAMFSKFSKLLNRKGIIVLLTSQKDLIEKLMTSKFTIIEKYNIFVGGKEAWIFKIIRL
jgi:tRNA G10  N-methylase Trm11